MSLFRHGDDSMEPEAEQQARWDAARAALGARPDQWGGRPRQQDPPERERQPEPPTPPVPAAAEVPAPEVPAAEVPATEVPAVTLAPTATDVPAATDLPAATDVPAATESPAEGGTPPQTPAYSWSSPDGAAPDAPRFVPAWHRPADENVHHEAGRRSAAAPAQPAPSQPRGRLPATRYPSPGRELPPQPTGRFTTPGNPGNGPPPSVDDLTAAALLRQRGSRPDGGWRRAIYALSAHTVNPGQSRTDTRRQKLIARASAPVPGCYRIAVISLKGGVGKTTMSVCLGATLASLRGDRVIAVDANPDRGTLSGKIPLQTTATVRNLLDDVDRLGSYADVRRCTSQSADRLEVLASESDPSMSQAFSERDYRTVASVLERFYNVVITDCGTGLLHSAMAGALALADQLVLVSSASVDGARSASATLDWLDAHGYGRLVAASVAVINSARPKSGGVDVDRLQEHFAARCRSVTRVPYDPHLEEGAEVDLSGETRTALLELAASVADGFGVYGRAVAGPERRPVPPAQLGTGHQQPGYHQPIPQPQTPQTPQPAYRPQGYAPSGHGPPTEYGTQPGYGNQLGYGDGSPQWQDGDRQDCRPDRDMAPERAKVLGSGLSVVAAGAARELVKEVLVIIGGNPTPPRRRRRGAVTAQAAGVRTARDSRIAPGADRPLLAEQRPHDGSQGDRERDAEDEQHGPLLPRLFSVAGPPTCAPAGPAAPAALCPLRPMSADCNQVSSAQVREGV